jgi:hypothetical protein
MYWDENKQPFNGLKGKGEFVVKACTT